jgi:hypothetical protein
MLFKISVVLLLIAVIIALGSGLYHLVHEKGTNSGLFKSLAWRVGLAAILFLYILLGIHMGWVTPGDPFAENRKNVKIENVKK